ncbi:MAG: MFS transporter [Chloroflexota bacterium]
MNSTNTPPGGFSAVIRTYYKRVTAFSPNARKYLISIILYGSAMGVYRLLFNFYVLSLGYDEALLGNLITASSLTSLIVALPMGYLADILGRKLSLILGNTFVGIAVLMIVLFPSVPIFIAMNILMGVAQSLSGVTMGPFLMENSADEERTYLFSFSSGLLMTASSVGNWIGGYMPAWFGVWLGVNAVSAPAYAWSLGGIVFMMFIALIPKLMLRSERLPAEERSAFAPISYMIKNPNKLGKLVLPMLITSIGAGLLMPFMNIFFRNVYYQSDAAIGTMFAWGSLAMGIGLLIAPALADRFGKIQVVVITQAISIPFLALLGFSPWFSLSALAYYVRLTLMNMSSPVYQTFVMEQVDPESRAMVASLTSMAHNFGWAFSPMLSGWFQVNYGFGPAFLSTITLYAIAVLMYYLFFWRNRKHTVPTFE